MLNNKFKKNLYKRVINKWLAQTVFNIDNIDIFQMYKAWLITLDNRITQYNNNYKGFSFASILKPVVLESVIKPIKEKIMD